jgi:hypothetical protein
MCLPRNTQRWGGSCTATSVVPGDSRGGSTTATPTMKYVSLPVQHGKMPCLLKARTGSKLSRSDRARLSERVASLRGGYECAFFAYPLAMRLAGRTRSVMNVDVYTPCAAGIQDMFLAIPVARGERRKKGREKRDITIITGLATNISVPFVRPYSMPVVSYCQYMPTEHAR